MDCEAARSMNNDTQFQYFIQRKEGIRKILKLDVLAAQICKAIGKDVSFAFDCGYGSDDEPWFSFISVDVSGYAGIFKFAYQRVEIASKDPNVFFDKETEKYKANVKLMFYSERGIASYDFVEFGVAEFDGDNWIVKLHR